MLNLTAWWIIVSFRYQDYIEYIIKKHETIAKNPPGQLFVNRIRDRVIFKTRTGYKTELLLHPEIIKLVASARKDVNQDKDEENVTKLESGEAFLVHCNLVNNNY